MSIARNVDAVLKYTASPAAGDFASESAVEAKTWTAIVGVQELNVETDEATSDTTAHGVVAETAIATTTKYKISGKINFIPGNATHLALLAAKRTRTAVGLLMATATDHTVAGTTVVAGNFLLTKCFLNASDPKGHQVIEFEAVPAPFDTVAEPAYSYIAS